MNTAQFAKSLLAIIYSSLRFIGDRTKSEVI